MHIHTHTHTHTHMHTYTPSFPSVPMMSFEFYKPSFFSKFLESHVVMAEVSVWAYMSVSVCG